MQINIIPAASRRMTGADDALEVTPEMARAGARVLADRYDLLGDEVDGMVATRVFLAMLEARADSTASGEREAEKKAS
jgi:hypothetical protein